MSDLSLFGEKRMTVKEVADILGYENDTIRKKVKELFPEIVESGKQTYLSEAQVTELKSKLVPRTLALKSGVSSVSTDLEMIEQTKNVMNWLNQKYEEEKQKRINAEHQLAIAAPKVELADAIGKTESFMSLTDAAKHFGIPPRKILIPWLQANKYLTSKQLPTMSAIHLGIMALRQSEPDRHGITHKQAVVGTNQLERFKKIVAEKIAKEMAQ